MDIHERISPVESGRQRPFRLEVGSLENVEDIYCALGRIIQVWPTNQIIKIGTSHSEDELFAQINVNALIPNPTFNTAFEGYSISVDLNYQNPNNQYWTGEQAGKLQELLVKDCGYDSLEQEPEKESHSLVIKDPKMGLLYRLNLGFENEKTAWAHQAIEFNQLLTELNKNHPQYNILERKLRKIINHLKDTLMPIATDSTIIIKPIDEGLFPSPIEELADDPEEIKQFKTITEKWAKFIEIAVNAMAKAKGIPQSGKLTLLPPYEIPQ